MGGASLAVADRPVPGGEVGRAFARAMEEGGIDAVAFERELKLLQPPPVPLLFAVLDRGLVLVPQTDGSTTSHALSVEEADVLWRVLAAAPRSALRRHLEIVAAQGEPRETRELALRLLGTAGTPEDFGLLARLAESRPGDSPSPRTTRDAFGEALARIVTRFPTGVWGLVDLYRVAVPALRSSIVRAVEEAEDDDSLRILSRLLGSDASMDALILSAVARRAQREALPVDEDIRARVRGYLRTGEGELALLAFLAVGRLEDFESVPVLMGEIESSDANRRACAFAALRAITRSNLRSDVEIWSRWYEGETAWWDDEATRTLAALRGRNGHRVALAINDVSRRKLNRHELAEALLPCLERDERELAILACEALAGLGSLRAVPALIRCLDPREPPTLRRAAGRALRSITGRNLPPDPERWLEASK